MLPELLFSGEFYFCHRFPSVQGAHTGKTLKFQVETMSLHFYSTVKLNVNARVIHQPPTKKKTTFQINYLRISGEHEVVQNRRNIRINLTWLKWARVPMLSPYRSISLNQTGILFENTLSITVDRKCERLHTRSSTHTSVHA